ncbi:MAG: YdcF family protein, partial [Candidatus Magasanikbacteria bacterium]|nr:YdcF family protein [Candidatus Magasanikbacteria bacterium]
MKLSLKKNVPIFFIFSIAIIVLFFYIQSQFNNQSTIYSSLDQVPTAPVALVFGAGLRPNGTPSDALRDRVLSAVDLYQAQKVQKLLMTGDNSLINYDEVSAMKKLAVDMEVPEDDVVLDYAGFDTYDSCYRARDIFGLSQIIAVSQEFHLPRVVFTCQSLGIDTVGYVADKQPYISARFWRVRESLARVKAWAEVKILKPEPKFLG